MTEDNPYPVGSHVTLGCPACDWRSTESVVLNQPNGTWHAYAALGDQWREHWRKEHTPLAIQYVRSTQRLMGAVVEMATEEVPFEVDDAVVLLLGAPAKSPSLNGRIEGITRLEKLVFLLDRETDVGKLLTEKPDFVAHNFGPFSAKVYQAVETLKSAGLITDSASLSPTEEDSWESENVIGQEPDSAYTTRDFDLTPLGRKYYGALVAELPKATERELRTLKDRFAGLPLRQLIRYVYSRYPALTDKSP